MPRITSETARAIASLRRSFGPRNPRKMMIEVQELLLRDIRNEKTCPADRAKCAAVLEKLEDRLRILRGRPLPGQMRPDWPVKEKRKKPAALLPLPSVDPLAEAEG
jgi:hypothetical protein